MDLETIVCIALALLIFGVYIFWKWDDEVPIFISLLNALFLWRFCAIKLGIAQWVSFNYGIPIEFSDALAIKALFYIALGCFFLIVGYCSSRRRNVPPIWNEAYSFRTFLHYKASVIVAGLLVSFLISRIFGGAAYSATGSSYALYLPFLTASTIVLGVLLLKHKSVNGGLKAALLGLLPLNILSTLNPSGRFALISWAICLAIVLFARFKFRIKALIYLSFAAVFFLAFSILGMRRDEYFSNLTLLEQFKISFLNLAQFNDLNMVDGLSMLIQVVPNYLDYSLGMGHLEILMRPIPRVLWPDKPLGAWQQKLSLVQTEHLYGKGAIPHLFSTGISPTLFGDFYFEAGVIGIVFLSLLYGHWIAKLINFSDQYSSDLRLVIKGMLLAFVFPLLRGGDLPGIVAFGIMAYWPLILFILLYRKFLKRQVLRSHQAMGGIP